MGVRYELLAHGQVWLTDQCVQSWRFLGSLAPPAKGNPTGADRHPGLRLSPGKGQGTEGRVVPGARGSAEQAEGHQAEMQKLREGLQGAGAGTTEDLPCGEADSGMGEGGNEEWRPPRGRGLGAGWDDSWVSCLRAFPSPGRTRGGQDAKDSEEGFGQGSPGRHVRKRPGAGGCAQPH